MAAEKGNAFYADVLSLYQNLHFLNTDGTQNKKTVVAYITELLHQYGLPKERKQKDTVYTIAGISIYPEEYFCPMSYHTGKLNITENTYTIHHYTASWKTQEEKKMKKREEWIISRIPGSLGKMIAKVSCLPLRASQALKKYGLLRTFLLLVKKYR